MTFEWTGQQNRIHDWYKTGTGNLLVRARAGSSKTTTIIHGLNIAKEDSILYAVFSKRAQVAAQAKITNQNVTVKTLHSLGYSFILRNWRGVMGSPYTEYNRLSKLFPDAPKQVHFQTARLVSFLKNLYINPTMKDAMETATERDIDAGNHVDEYPNEKLCEMALASINLSLEFPKDRKISFDDMMWLPNIKNWVTPTFNLLNLDEWQDANLPQMEMVIKACKPEGRICAVGDSFQNIFGFRGTLANGLELFKEKLRAQELPLTVSFRCSNKIISMAKLIVPDIEAAPNAIEGEVISMNEEKMLNDIKVKDVVLSRTNAPLMKTCLALIRKRKPAYIEGREIGKILINLVESFEANTVSEFYDRLQKWQDNKVQSATGWFATGIIELANDQAETLRALAESCLNVDEIISKINSLFLDADYVRVPSIVCMTSHKSKGSEFDNVYMLSETYQNKRRKLNEYEKQQESNLIYVSYTRAKKKLVFVSTK